MGTMPSVKDLNSFDLEQLRAGYKVANKSPITSPV